MSKQLLKEIKEGGKETLLLFYADWCGNCKTVNHFTTIAQIG